MSYPDVKGKASQSQNAYQGHTNFRTNFSRCIQSAKSDQLDTLKLVIHFVTVYWASEPPDRFQIRMVDQLFQIKCLKLSLVIHDTDDSGVVEDLLDCH